MQNLIDTSNFNPPVFHKSREIDITLSKIRNNKAKILILPRNCCFRLKSLILVVVNRVFIELINLEYL